MSKRDREDREKLRDALVRYEEKHGALPGIANEQARSVLIEQLIESIHRVSYPARRKLRPISERRSNPADPLFDPLLAAMWHQANSDVEEASWLVFLFVHFGKHKRGGWRYVRDVYGRLGQGGVWNWPTIKVNPKSFRDWLRGNYSAIKDSAEPGGFGAHRRYVSLDADKPAGTGAAVETYVDMINDFGSHAAFFSAAVREAGGKPHSAFDVLYKRIGRVASFGRLAKFDYLAMIGKMGLAPIAPGSTYIGGSTGPSRGGRLLFGMIDDGARAATVDVLFDELDAELKVGKQVLEDAVCNWQKSPSTFRRFRG